MDLKGKTILITGAAARVGRAMALAAAEAGCNIVIHYWRSEEEAQKTKVDAEEFGVEATLVQGNLANAEEAVSIVERACDQKPIYGLVNSASLFQDHKLADTDLPSWEMHMAVNLRAPFLMSQTFAKLVGEGEGRIVNILDWRALRPGADHFAYTISKAGLAAMTRSLAVSLAPNIIVNAIAFGAILPPSDGGDTEGILEKVPAMRWANLDEVGETLLFLLEGPTYITGEIIHLAGGRQLI